MANREGLLSFSEMTDMILIMGKCNSNASLAARRYADKFPTRHHPKRRFFLSLVNRLRESGNFKHRRVGQCGRQLKLRPNEEEQILQIVEETPSISTRILANQINNGGNNNIKSDDVRRVFKQQLLYPYHVQKVQALLPLDSEARVTFCNWICQENNDNINFSKFILFSDEATFTRNGVTNIHNTHTWAAENPKFIVEAHHQVSFKVNVWAGIIDNFLLGPFFLPPRLNADEFLHFLQTSFADLLDDLPLAVRQNMWFQLDGAPPHYGRIVQNHLNQIFPNRWIGRGRLAPVKWPPRSPDLNPLDFCFWGFMKDFVYMVPIVDEQHLRLRILEGAEQFRVKPHIFHNIRFSFIKRCRMCVREGGSHVEHLI